MSRIRRILSVGQGAAYGGLLIAQCPQVIRNLSRSDVRLPTPRLIFDPKHFHVAITEIKVPDCRENVTQPRHHRQQVYSSSAGFMALRETVACLRRWGTPKQRMKGSLT
jgi:hypothetical protein